MARHKSDSSEQLDAENFILGEIAQRESIKFDDGPELEIGARPDGINQNMKVAVEVYAHIGHLKGAQLHKVKADLLKLVYIERKLGGNWKKIMCFASNRAASYLEGSSWCAEAAKSFGVEVIVVSLPDEQKQLVLAAQQRQRMVNAHDDSFTG